MRFNTQNSATEDTEVTEKTGVKFSSVFSESSVANRF